MTSTRQQTLFFGNLDALRFLAFLSVFISHTFTVPNTGNKLTEVAYASVTMVFLGVPFFFTLSSFLISYRLLSEVKKRGEISLIAFYKNRILRIWPAYFFLLLICFVIIPFASSFLKLPETTLPPLWPFLFFVANFYIIKFGAGFSFALTILWSISIEEQFYLLWGSLLRFLRKWLAVILILLSIISICFSYLWLYVWYLKPENLVIHSVYVIQNFAAGAALAWFASKNSTWFNKLRKSHFSLWLIPYILLPVSSVFIDEMIMMNIIKSLCFAAILFHQCFIIHPGFEFGKWKVVNYLGKISYGLYLYHALIILVSTHLFFKQPTDDFMTTLLRSVLMLLFTILFSAASYEWMEKKFLKLKSHRLT